MAGGVLRGGWLVGLVKGEINTGKIPLEARARIRDDQGIT